MTDYLAYATTATGVPITECEVCGQRHPVTRAHCSRCRSWSAFQRSGLCLICSEIVAAHGVSRRPEGADERLSEYTGTTTKAAPAGASTPGVRGPDPYEGGALTQDSRVSSSVVLDG